MDKLPRGQVVIVPAPDESMEDALEQFREERPWAKWDPASAEGLFSGRAGLVIGWQALATALLPALCTALGAWLGSRNGRRVRIKLGDFEAEAQTQEQVEKLLARAQKLHQKIQQLLRDEELAWRNQQEEPTIPTPEKPKIIP